MDLEEPTVDLYMTPSPQTIGCVQPLSEAHQLMRKHGIRHLPVLDGEKLVGVISQRDLHLFETLDDVDPEKIAVSEAMSEDTYAVSPESTVREVAAHMAAHKYGSAVIVDQGKVSGIFTAVDGLRALSLMLSQLRQANR
jgi:acetoin utilization protein AcuB